MPLLTWAASHEYSSCNPQWDATTNVYKLRCCRRGLMLLKLQVRHPMQAARPETSKYLLHLIIITMLSQKLKRQCACAIIGGHLSEGYQLVTALYGVDSPLQGIHRHGPDAVKVVLIKL